MNRAVLSLLVVLGLTAGWYLASPYLAVRSLGTALKEGDQVELEERIDFARVRDDLKSQLGASLAAAAPKASDNPFAALALAFGQKLADTAIDAMVTPDAIASLARGEATPPEPLPAGQPENESQPRPFDDASIDREGLSRFSAWVATGDDRKTRFVFRRDGLRWVLTNIRLGLPGSIEEGG